MFVVNFLTTQNFTPLNPFKSVALLLWQFCPQYKCGYCDRCLEGSVNYCLTSRIYGILVEVYFQPLSPFSTFLFPTDEPNLVWAVATSWHTHCLTSCVPDTWDIVIVQPLFALECWSSLGIERKILIFLNIRLCLVWLNKIVACNDPCITTAYKNKRFWGLNKYTVSHEQMCCAVCGVESPSSHILCPCVIWYILDLFFALAMEALWSIICWTILFKRVKETKSVSS
jgi:hypothetical protein